MIVYLVGMPGSGKTTAGGEVAGRLGVPFVDLDAEIERAAGRSVGELFADRARTAFRALEARALLDASRHDPAVVACGGGVVLEPANRITLRNTGVCVFLDVSLDAAARARSPSRRPSADPRGRRPGAVACALANRSTGSSPRTSWTASGPPGEVADAIVEELRWSA